MSLSVKNFGGGGSIGSVENLLVPTLGTQTKNGVTCTANGDGTYTLNGTATSETNFTVTSIKLPIGEYKILGCPKGGNKDNGYYIFANGNGLMYDEGNGVICSVITPKTVNVYLSCASGTVCDNLIFKPMLTTNLRATYKEFVKRVGGFVNLFNIDKATFTNYGITCTNNGDGTYTLNGTCTTETATNWMTIGTMSVESGKTYKFSGCPSGGSPSTYGTYITGVGSEHGDGRVFTATSNSIEYGIRVAPQQTLNNLVFKPMLTESLLPEYFDFVKGVADGITPQMFDCTRMVKSTFVPTTTGSIYSTYPNIPHNFGSKPKVLIMGIRDKSKYSTIGNTLCWWIAEGLTSNYSYMIGFRATTDGGRARNINQTSGFVLGDTYLTVTSSATSTGAIYLIGGETYDIIAMA